MNKSLCRYIISWRKTQRIFTIVLLIISFGQGFAFADERDKPAHPDIIANRHVEVLPGQVIGRLLLNNSDAVIAGAVTRGVLVFNGNLTIASGAQIDGLVLVIGGQIVRQEGAYTNNMVWAIPAQSIPRAGTVFWSILFAGIAVFILLFITVRFFWEGYKKTWLYPYSVLLLKKWPAVYTLLALCFIGFSLAVFANLAWHTLFKHTLDFFDNIVIFIVRYFATPRLDQIMILLSSFGYSYYYNGLVTIIFLLLAFYRKWTEIFFLTLCLAGGGVLNFLLKHLFERARPDMFPVVYESGYSFPSGHAMVSLCYYGMLSYLISRKISSWNWRAVVFIITLLLVFAIGISRIYLGVHYPTDVLAGYAAGAAWLTFCISLHAWRKHKRV